MSEDEERAIEEEAERQGANFWVSSLYGVHSRRGFVSIKWRDTATMVTPAKAREIAMMLLQCAETADQEEWLVHWAMERLGLAEDEVPVLVREFREYRESASGGDDEP